MAKILQNSLFKESSTGPTLSWVEIGVSDLANVEIKNGLSNGDKVLFYQARV